jgi:hypothetical protein
MQDPAWATAPRRTGRAVPSTLAIALLGACLLAGWLGAPIVFAQSGGAPALPPSREGDAFPPARKVAESLLREEASLRVGATTLGVAINADESILAAASAEGSDRVRITLFDRPSRAKLGVILTDVGKAPRLRFSPVEDLLLVSGSRVIQLWELPIAPLDPEKPLARKFLRWEVKLKDGQPPGAVRFGMPPSMVFWSLDGALYRRPAAVAGVAEGQPVWQASGDAGAIGQLAFLPDGSAVAVVYQERKEIDLLDLNSAQVRQVLQGHRFPVVSESLAPGRPLVSLDKARPARRPGSAAAGVRAPAPGGPGRSPPAARGAGGAEGPRRGGGRAERGSGRPGARSGTGAGGCQPDGALRPGG